MDIRKSSIRLYADPKAVITMFLQLPGNSRVTNIINRVAVMDEKEVDHLYEKLMEDFGSRHREITKLFANHFDKINVDYIEKLHAFYPKKRLLLGAFFTKEYSIQSAALFNPSIVPHPDQQGVKEGEQRFVMSLRATGEGHISSIAFQTGIVTANGEVQLDAVSPYYTCLQKNENAPYTKAFITKCTALVKDFKKELLDSLPDTFTANEAIAIIDKKFGTDESMHSSIEKIKQSLDSNYELEPSAHLPLNERVLFPNAKAESMGMEDVRFVEFNEGGKKCYYASYTAYNGREIKSQLIQTDDFNVFKIRTMYGAAVSDKGMALLPEKVNGKYVMISRQGGEKINIMYSDDLYRWDEYNVLLEPEYNWELVQLGNCGSPIKTEKGWLLLTHGVGVMRTYVISAILLDLNNPSIILARLDTPLIAADETEREGYVPNVVYTCGLLKHGRHLIIPYAVSDSATGFASVELNALLNEMKPYKKN